jgi:hypothetical protein
MGAQAILERYLARKRDNTLVPSELRKHLVSVAAGAKLRVTDSELDAISGISETEPKRGRKKKATPKAGNDSTTTI